MAEPNPLTQSAHKTITIRTGVSTSGSIVGIQEVSTLATGGTFRLLWEDQTTAALDFGASAAELVTALEALDVIIDVVVTGAGTEVDPWIVNFNDLGNTTATRRPVGKLGADTRNLTGDSPTVMVRVTQLGETPGLSTIGYKLVSIEQPSSCEGVRWGFLGDIRGLDNFVDIMDPAGVRLFVVKSPTVAEITTMGPDVADVLKGYSQIQIESLDGSNVAVNQAGQTEITVNLVRQ